MRLGRRRSIDRALCGDAEPGDVRGLVALLRDDARARAAYDRGAWAMRALERTAVAEVEIDWVERRLEADGILGDRVAAPATPRWWWIAGAVMAAGAAVLLMRPTPPGPGDDPEDPFTARGHDDPRAGWLALSVLCDGAAGPSGSLSEVAGTTCPEDGTIGFAIRVDARHRGGEHLVVFGIDADGDVQYYVPTPDWPAPIVERRDAWVPLDRAVKLSVNHAVGRVRVFAAVLAHAPTTADIDRAAAKLDVADDEIPWLERLGPADPLVADCGGGACIGAQLDFRIDPRHP